MLARVWQNIKFTSFCVDEKLTHQVIYFNNKSSIFLMSRWKFTHQVYYIVISCQFFLTKVHICWSSFLYLYGIQIFPCLHNFIEGIKNKCQVYTFINQEGLVMTQLKELGRSGNYVLWNWTWPWLWISSQCRGIFWNYFVVVQPKQCKFRITRWRSSRVPIEKTRTIRKNFAHYISMPNGNQRRQRP